MKIKLPKGASRRFSEVLSETNSEEGFSSRRLSVLLPLIVFPLDLYPRFSSSDSIPCEPGGALDHYSFQSAV